MQQCVELQRAGVQPTMPLLGSFCIEKLNLQMKVIVCVLCTLSMMSCTALYSVISTGFLLLVPCLLVLTADFPSRLPSWAALPTAGEAEAVFGAPQAAVLPL